MISVRLSSRVSPLSSLGLLAVQRESERERERHQSTCAAGLPAVVVSKNFGNKLTLSQANVTSQIVSPVA